MSPPRDRVDDSGRPMLPAGEATLAAQSSFQVLLAQVSLVHDQEVARLEDIINKLSAALSPEGTPQRSDGALFEAMGASSGGFGTNALRRDSLDVEAVRGDLFVSEGSNAAPSGSHVLPMFRSSSEPSYTRHAAAAATSSASAPTLSAPICGEVPRTVTSPEPSESSIAVDALAPLPEHEPLSLRARDSSSCFSEQDINGELRPTMRVLSESVDQEVGPLSRGQYVWQWQRSKGGFRSYPEQENHRIEESYRRGDSKCRLKSGGEGKTPMEIFFVDMIQLDPQSRNVRKVRRLGSKSLYVSFARQVHALVRSLVSGAPRWESFKKYKKRQQGMLGGSGTESHFGMNMATLSRPTSKMRAYQLREDSIFTQIVKSYTFLAISLLATLSNVVWIGISVEVGEISQSLFTRDAYSVVLEHGFLVYFLAELVLQFMSLRHRRFWIKNVWFVLDALCTATTFIEVLVIPYTGTISGSTAVLQTMRMTRMGRLLRLFRDIKEVAIVVRGIVSGMRSAAFIWVLMAVLLYTCGVLMTATNNSELLQEKYFGSLGQSIISLIVHGIALDGLVEFCGDLRRHDGLFLSVVFFVFVFITYFGLLNMLVGAFCNVAIEVAMVEKDYLEIGYLQTNLQEIVECYLEDDKETLKLEHFRLIMQNADVLQTLRKCGTDLDGLMLLTEVLFPHEDSEITFLEFFSVIVRLRKGKPASVSELIGLQEFTKQRVDKLEHLIREGLKMGSDRKASLTRTGSVLDAPRVKRLIQVQDRIVTPEERQQKAQDQKIQEQRQRGPWTSQICNGRV